MSTVTREGNIIQVKREEEKERKKECIYMTVTYPHLQNMSSSLYPAIIAALSLAFPPAPPTTHTHPPCRGHNGFSTGEQS